MKVYCQECGTPHEYSTKKPNFCQNCGNSFATSKASTPVVKAKPSVNDEDEEEDVEETDGDESEASVPQLGGLDVEIQMPTKTKISIKDVMGTAQGGDDNFTRDNDEPISQKDFLESFKREAGAIKPQSRKRKGEST